MRKHGKHKDILQVPEITVSARQAALVPYELPCRSAAKRPSLSPRAVVTGRGPSRSEITRILS